MNVNVNKINVKCLIMAYLQRVVFFSHGGTCIF